jgi:hypothetical protein
MKTTMLKLAGIAIVFTLFSLASCKKEEDPEPEFAPVIESFSPVSGNGPVGVNNGTSVIITGTNFSATTADNTVKFNGTTAIVSAATTTALTTSVPQGSTTGKITVTVNGLTATSAADFIVNQPPTIATTSLAYALPGATLDIIGTNFSATLANNAVLINGTPATVIAATATVLTVTIPVGATTGLITVTVFGISVTSSFEFEVLKDFPRNGLVAWYPFNGNANDASGNNLNGTITEAMPATDRFNRANQSYSFDGVNDKIVMGNPALLQINTQITVAGWINSDILDVVPGGNGVTFLSKIFFDPGQGGNPTKGYRMYQNAFGNGTPSLALVVYGASFTSLYVGSTPITAGSWIFVTLVINNASVKFYHNGAVTNSLTNAANSLDDGSGGDLNIGTYGGGFFFDGKIDDIMIYNRALSDAEVTQLFQQTVTKY